MKTIILFSLALIFTANATLAPTPAPVLDSDGNYLRTGVKYIIMPAINDSEHGGLFPSSFNNQGCPSGIAQSRLYESGTPITFTLVNHKKGMIRLSTDVKIKFDGVTGCDYRAHVWKVKYDHYLKQYALMVGVEGKPGPEVFKIEKTDDGYKFVFCSPGKGKCMGVGTVADGDRWLRLVLSNNPASFVFWKTY